MTVETQQDVEQLQRIGNIVATVLHRMLDAVEPGMTTKELDNLGKQWLEREGAQSAPQLVYRFPAATCISINEEAAHGIPGERRIQAGDVVNIDVSAELNGYFADTGGTRVVPPTTAVKSRLCHATQQALQAAINEVRAGVKINQIGKAIEKVAKHHRFKIIENLAGHGVGRGLHEEPKNIVGYYEPRDTRVLEEGMVIAIEPFLSTKSTQIVEAEDGWTLLCEPGNLSAQYEHSLIVTRNKPIILTLH